jgi:hypothetical protein
MLSDPYSSSITLSNASYLDLEADVFWCLTTLLDRVQDNFTFGQPGIQRMVFRLRELVSRIDPKLDEHFTKHNVMYIHFAFRWMACLLQREVNMACTVRMIDTYLAEEEATPPPAERERMARLTHPGSGRHSRTSSTDAAAAASSLAASSTASSSSSSSLSTTSVFSSFSGFRAFHIYVCASFLLHFSPRLLQMGTRLRTRARLIHALCVQRNAQICTERGYSSLLFCRLSSTASLDFQELVLFLQKLPTEDWGTKEIETLLSKAFLYKRYAHAACEDTTRTRALWCQAICVELRS